MKPVSIYVYEKFDSNGRILHQICPKNKNFEHHFSYVPVRLATIEEHQSSFFKREHFVQVEEGIFLLSDFHSGTYLPYKSGDPLLLPQIDCISSVKKSTSKKDTRWIVLFEVFGVLYRTIIRYSFEKRKWECTRIPEKNGKGVICSFCQKDCSLKGLCHYLCRTQIQEYLLSLIIKDELFIRKITSESNPDRIRMALHGVLKK